MWVVYALVGAFLAAVGTIAAKIGLKGVDSNVLTTIRGIVMAGAVLLATLLLGKFSFASLALLTPKTWLFAILSGLAGAGSWLFFFYALSFGDAGAVSAIDRLSIVFTVVLATLFLSEAFTLQIFLGALLVSMGAILITIPWSRIVEFIQKLFT